MKAVIFGAGSLGHQVYHAIKNDFDEVLFVDNNFGEIKSQYKILPVDYIKEGDFDKLFIAARAGADNIYNQLTSDLGVDVGKIDRSFLAESDYLRSFDIRNRFLKSFAGYACAKPLCGDVAEIGVSRGDFAREINACFPDRKLYLFDTFEGFDESDLSIDASKNKNFGSMKQWMETVGFLSDTSEEVVVAKLPHPEKVFVRKGRFPETFNIVDGNFCFVNIDTDLYAPTKAGLELFYPLMNRGGVILIHDYFSPCLAGVAAAVDEFIQHIDIPVIPIGDDLSIAILKP